MCGRYTLTAGPDQLTQRFGTLILERGTGRFNIAPGQEVAAVAGAGRRELLLRWGLVPHWAEDERVGYRMINARCETVGSKPTFRPLVESAGHRCLILADGFYEWQKPEDPKAPRVPMRFTVGGGEPFAFAGLWTGWRSPAGDVVESATILTTSANDLVAPVHDRMPVILAGADAEAAWLDPAVDGPAAARLLVPFGAAGMAAHPVSRLVNSVRNDGPQILEA